MTKSMSNWRNGLTATVAALTIFLLAGTVACAQRELKPPPEDQVAKVAEAVPEEATAEPAEPRKALIFCRCDGFYHGCIPLANEALKMLGEKTGAYSALVSQDMSVFSPEKLEPFDAVIFNNTTRLNPDESQRKALLDFLADGKGVVGIHAATDNFYDWPEGAAMMGGLFAGHPWGGGGTWAVKIVEPGHPLNQAFDGEGFWIRDEIYQIRDPYSREKLRALLALDMTKEANQRGGREDKDNAIAWIQGFHGGRVFYCSLGHNNEIFWNPTVLKHYLDGIQYALGDLKADAAPSAKLPSQPEPALAPER